MQTYPPLAHDGRRPGRAARTTGSSTPSTAARSTPACRCASCTPASSPTSRPRPPTSHGGTRSWSCPASTSPTTPRSTGWRPTPRPAATWCSVRAPRYADHEARARAEVAARAARRGRRGLVRRVQQPHRRRCRSAPPPASPLELPARRRGHPLGGRPAGRTAPRCSPATTTRTSAAGRPSPPAATARAGSPTSAPCPTRPRRRPVPMAGPRAGRRALAEHAGHRHHHRGHRAGRAASSVRPQLVLGHRRLHPPRRRSRSARVGATTTRARRWSSARGTSACSSRADRPHRSPGHRWWRGAANVIGTWSRR